MLTVEPNQIRKGEFACLRWDSTAAAGDVVELIPECKGQQLPPQGCWFVSPSETTRYELRVSGRPSVTVVLLVEPSPSIVKVPIKLVIAAVTFLVVTALAYHWRFGRQQETASLLARPSRLARPGTVTLHYAGPQASELELAPSNGCDRRPAYWICHVAESTAFTVTVKSGSTEVARVTAEVAVESPASVR